MPFITRSHFAVPLDLRPTVAVRAAHIRVERRDGPHIVGGEIDTKRVYVLGETLGLVGWNDDDPALNLPHKSYLRGRLATVTCSDLCQHGLVGTVAPWTVQPDPRGE